MGFETSVHKAPINTVSHFKGTDYNNQCLSAGFSCTLILIWTYIILQLQSTILLVIYNTQKNIKLAPTEKSIIQHYAIAEADMLLKIVNTGFNNTITLVYKEHIILFQVSIFNLPIDSVVL